MKKFITLATLLFELETESIGNDAEGHFGDLGNNWLEKFGEKSIQFADKFISKKEDINELAKMLKEDFNKGVWEADKDGLYGKGKFLSGVSYSRFASQLSADSGFVYHWDPVASAPYLYNAHKKWFVTFDNSASVILKTKYAVKQRLNGIMFWQLADDSFSKGLLDIVDETIHKSHR